MDSEYIRVSEGFGDIFVSVTGSEIFFGSVRGSETSLGQ